ncbi:MAG: NAD-dependent deacylase [Bacteroidales bacterium]|jgi:NAD-dependent deacetylase|nr:NAD-dependent deacylase [Bacteroidales bacterium]MDD2617568.1 NAD-dependent deacylase [Bacteroidales bacterium]MDD4640296.1 NAD-dependent deacylase [Bacteroidales bacterium]
MKKLVVLTGAGMSAESGIKTFRGSGGLWEEYPVEMVATPEGWNANPELVTQFYNKRRKQLLEVEPNAGHYELAAMEKSFDVQIITQNVDNLHERAGSSKVLHLHGELTKVRGEVHSEYIVELKPENYEVRLGDCTPFGDQLRPHIVWFHELVTMIEPAMELVKQADYFVVIGSSLVVYPAAGLLHIVPGGSPSYVIDPEELTLCRFPGIKHIKLSASEGIRKLHKLLLEHKEL